MVYVESAPLFCVATNTVKERSKNTLHKQAYVAVHPLEELAETSPLEPNANNTQASAT